jgi:hypothetical protein
MDPMDQKLFPQFLKHCDFEEKEIQEDETNVLNFAT